MITPGSVFTNLTVHFLVQEKSGDGRLWQCLCKCGKTRAVPEYRLKGGYTKSCGCLKRGQNPPIRIKHGMSSYSGFKVWESMMRRCFNKNDKDYPSYGGRGITVCDKWKNPANFAKDMGEKPLGCSIERIDVNSDYCPSNCRWATPLEQGANKRNNRIIELNGEKLHLAEWSRRLGISPSTVINRLNAGMDPALALTLPSRRPRRNK
jgi:hypothetical protein